MPRTCFSLLAGLALAGLALADTDASSDKLGTKIEPAFVEFGRQGGTPGGPEWQEGHRRRLPLLRLPRVQQLLPAAGRPGTRPTPTRASRSSAVSEPDDDGRRAAKQGRGVQAARSPSSRIEKLAAADAFKAETSRPRRSCSTTTSSCAIAAGSTTPTPPGSRRTRRRPSHDLQERPRRPARRQGRSATPATKAVGCPIARERDAIVKATGDGHLSQGRAADPAEPLPGVPSSRRGRAVLRS